MMFGSLNTPDLMNKINDYLFTLEQTHGDQLGHVTVEHRPVDNRETVIYTALIYYEFFSDKSPEDLDPKMVSYKLREIER